jgi:hypothetical protein
MRKTERTSHSSPHAFRLHVLSKGQISTVAKEANNVLTACAMVRKAGFDFDVKKGVEGP